MDRETVDEVKRHFGIVAEDLRSDVRAVAEGQQGIAEGLQRLEGKQDGFEAKVEHQLDAFRAEMHAEFAAVRGETTREFEETRALIRLSYSELDRRMRGLEGEVTDLRTRVGRLEE